MENLEIKVTRFWKIIYSLIFIFLFGYPLLNLAIGEISITTTLISILFAISCTLYFFPYLYKTRVFIDKNGITIRDPQILMTFQFSWSDISNTWIKTRLDKVVVIELHNLQKYKKSLSLFTRLSLTMRQIAWGFPFGISTIDLEVKAEKINLILLERINMNNNQDVL